MQALTLTHFAQFQKTKYIVNLSAHIGSVRPYVGGWNNNDINLFQIMQNWLELELTCNNSIFYTITQLLKSRIRSF